MTRFEKLATATTILISAGGLGVATLQYSQSTQGSGALSFSANSPSTMPEKFQPTVLPQLLKEETMGRNIEYVEQIIGKPMAIERTSGTFQYRHYEVDGCKIRLMIDAEKAVSSVKMELSPSCQPEWSKMYPALRTIDGKRSVTLEDIFPEGAGLIEGVKGCLLHCGNAGEHEIEITKYAFRTTNNISVRAIFSSENPVGMTAQLELADDLKSKWGESSVWELSTTCGPEFNNLVLNKIGKIPIDAIEFTNNPSFPRAGECKTQT